MRLDVQARIAAANGFACRLLGHEEVDLIGRRFFEVLGGSHVADELVRRCIDAGTESLAVVQHTVDGRPRSTELHCSHVDDTQGTNGVMALLQDVTDRVGAELEREVIVKQIEFLADASAQLGSSLKLMDVLETLAGITVPFLADWCTIDLIDKEQGALRRIIVRHHDPGLSDVAQRLKDFVPDRKRRTPIIEVLDSGRAMMIQPIEDALVESGANSEEHRRLVRKLGASSAIIVPLQARDRLIGSMMLVSSGPQRRYGPAELALAQDIAQRAALAMDNARLFQEHSYVARKLQESLLPPELPSIPGIELGACYKAAGEDIEVGGDFYDMFRIGGKHWGVVIGDVSGKGPDAAAITALARYTTRAAAMQMRSPRRILATLNEAILRQTVPERFATVAFARIEVDKKGGPRKVTLSCGGHPLPLVLRAASGEVESFGSPGMVLGLFDKPDLRDDSTVLQEGDVLLFFTDGVTEARRQGVLLGGYGLRRALEGCGGASAQEVADQIGRRVIEFQNGTLSDDIAIVAVRVPPR